MAYVNIEDREKNMEYYLFTWYIFFDDFGSMSSAIQKPIQTKKKLLLPLIVAPVFPHTHLHPAQPVSMPVPLGETR